MKLPAQPYLAVDLDGTIRDPATDGLMDGCGEGLRRLRSKYRLILFTARGDLEWVADWLSRHYIRDYFVDITNRKPRCDYLDNQAWRFTTWAQALEDLS